MKPPMVDDNAAPCMHCKQTRVQYTCNAHEFKAKCLNPACGQPRWVPVAFEVHKRVKTTEGFRAWLAVVDSQ